MTLNELLWFGSMSPRYEAMMTFFSVVQLLYLFLSLHLSSTAKRNQLDLTFA